ncbi:MAG TPA: hypothetical protein PKD55_03565 [Bellilinea sp.]|nr:hypothetical protein [Bellilinea sp.]
MRELTEPNQTKRNSSKVTVCPPSDAHIEAYARKVCQRLSKGRPDHDLIDGFTRFMKLVVKIRTEQLGVRHEEESR